MGMILANASILLASSSIAAPFIEREGRYELNWTTGKVRFYGVGQAGQSDENYRTAEQSAWADGLKSAEKLIPSIMANRIGPVERLQVEKLSKLAQSTISISTTYFGDQRVKVLLEAPIQKMTPQLVPGGESSPSELTSASETRALTISLPKGAQPVAFVRVVDEHGRDMVQPRDIIAAVHAGAPMARWYRHEALASDGSRDGDSEILSAVMPQRGVIRVQSSDWKPAFARSLVHGKTSFIIQ